MKSKTDEIDAKLKEIFSALFKVKPDELHDGSNPDNVPGWDSLQNLNLIVSIEQEFGIAVSPEEASQMLNLGLIKEIVAEGMTQ